MFKKKGRKKYANSCSKADFLPEFWKKKVPSRWVTNAWLYAAALQLYLLSFRNYIWGTMVLCKVLTYSGVADACKIKQLYNYESSSDDSFLALQFFSFSGVA